MGEKSALSSLNFTGFCDVLCHICRTHGDSCISYCLFTDLMLVQTEPKADAQDKKKRVVRAQVLSTPTPLVFHRGMFVVFLMFV